MEPHSSGVESFPGHADVQLSWEALPCVFVTLGAPEQGRLLTGKHRTLKGTP